VSFEMLVDRMMKHDLSLEQTALAKS